MNFLLFSFGMCAVSAGRRVAVILLPMSRFTSRRFLSLVLAALLCILPATPSFAWGPDGHRIVNRLAAEKLPAEVPEFLRTQAAIDEIEYLGPEPDRWRSANEPELNAAQAPEHFIDLELADMVGKLPRRRYDFIAALYATGLTHPDQARDLRPEKVGLQPWVTNEVYQRLQAALREYREQTARHAGHQGGGGGGHLLCRVAGALCGRRLDAAAHHGELQRLGGEGEPEAVCDLAGHPLAVGERVRPPEHQGGGCRSRSWLR